MNSIYLVIAFDQVRSLKVVNSLVTLSWMNVFGRVKLQRPLVWDFVHLILLALSTICIIIIPVAHKVRPCWVFFQSVSYIIWAYENLPQQQQGQGCFRLVHSSNQSPLLHHWWHWNELQKFTEPEVHKKGPWIAGAWVNNCSWVTIKYNTLGSSASVLE